MIVTIYSVFTGLFNLIFTILNVETTYEESRVNIAVYIDDF